MKVAYIDSVMLHTSVQIKLSDYLVLWRNKENLQKFVSKPLIDKYVTQKSQNISFQLRSL